MVVLAFAQNYQAHGMERRRADFEEAKGCQADGSLRKRDSNGQGIGNVNIVQNQERRLGNAELQLEDARAGLKESNLEKTSRFGRQNRSGK